MSAAQQPVSSFDSMDPATTEDPYAFYAALQDQAPVHWDEASDSFLVSRYEDVHALIMDPLRFSSAAAPVVKPPPAEALPILLQALPPVPTLLSADPPAHARYRALVRKAFTPRTVAKLEDTMREVANGLVDEFAADGSVEFIAQFASLFPVTIIADQLGVSRGDRASFKKWGDDNVAFLGGMIGDERWVECAKSMVDMQQYFLERVRECRVEPRDGILSTLANATLEDGRQLDDAEIISIIQQIVVAGHETNTSALAEGMRLLVGDAQALRAVRDDFGLVPNMIEEVLRLASPVQTLFRIATQDTEIAGVAVPKHSRIAAMYGAANRDPRRFPDPHRFDPRRENARDHLSFGQGEHYCVGAGLARAELVIGFETLLRRISGWRFAPGANDFRHHPSFILRGLEELHLEFDVVA